MSTTKAKKIGTRLTTPPKIRPEGGRKVTFGVPPLPAGKFAHCEGQMALDLHSDDPDALVES